MSKSTSEGRCMHLLMVSPYLPHPSWGAGTRSYYLLKALAREHDVSLLALTDSTALGADERLRRLEDLARPVRLVARPAAGANRWQQLQHVVRGRSYLLSTYTLTQMQAALDELLARGRYDAVLFEHVLIAGYRLPGNVK